MDNDFSSFTFAEKSNKQIEIVGGLNNGKVRDNIFNTMQFTHQNLNRDFLTGDLEAKKDQFADFMSMVDEKYQEEKKNKMMKKKKEI